MDVRAQLRRAGVLFINHLVKEAQLHPVESLRQGAIWNVGLHDLQKEYGLNLDEDSMAHQRMLATNPEYFQRLRSLYDKAYGQQTAAPTLSEAVAAQRKPGNIEAENAPKVVSAPK